MSDIIISQLHGSDSEPRVVQTIKVDFATDPPVLQEVSPGVFAYIQPDGSWMINNTGFIVGSDAITVIDTCSTEPRTKAFIAAIHAVSDKPLRILINTHFHADHTHGNSFFLPNATIIAHEICRKGVIATGLGLKPLFPTANFGELSVAPPFVTFEDRLNIYVDNLKLELFYVGPSHTTSDVAVWIPERSVLFTGDLIFKDCTPFVLQGAIAPYFAVLDRLRSLNATTIIPGHGPVCGSECYDEVADYLHFVQATAKKGFEAGLEPLELARQTDLGKFANLNDAERIVGNLHRAYSELRGEPYGTPLPIVEIAQEMQAYNGHPLRCLA